LLINGENFPLILFLILAYILGSGLDSLYYSDNIHYNKKKELIHWLNTENPMTQKTEEKILNAALKIFAKRGYSAATTKSIAQESGLSEFTLFRKFKTKENLFNMVLNQSLERMQGDLDSLLRDNASKTRAEFLESFIRDMARFYQNHIEAFSIFLNEDSSILEPTMTTYINNLTTYIEQHVKSDKIDPQTLVLTTTAFIYILTTEKYHGRSFVNYEEALENFIKSMVNIIKS